MIIIKTIFSVSTALYEILRNKIIEGCYMPGFHLVEADIMSEYSVSRVTIREVLRLLEGDGLVVAIPNKGVRVRNLSPQEIIEYWQVHEYLYSLAIKLAVEKNQEKLMSDLQAIMIQEAQAIQNHDFKTHTNLMIKFHKAIIDTCDNERLSEMLYHLLTLMQLPQALKVLELRMDLSFESHSRILEAVKSNDAQLAEQRIKEHFHDTIEHYRLYI